MKRQGAEQKQGRREWYHWERAGSARGVDSGFCGVRGRCNYPGQKGGIACFLPFLPRVLVHLHQLERPLQSTRCHARLRFTATSQITNHTSHSVNTWPRHRTISPESQQQQLQQQHQQQHNKKQNYATYDPQQLSVCPGSDFSALTRSQ